MPPGYFITFEGVDGSGKTTQIKRLAHWFESRGEAILLTRQPGGTPIGDRIRALLLDSRTDHLAPLAELALMFADRAQSIARVIAPALADGRLVLCDRFTDSTEAYQGAGRQLGSEPVLALHQALCGALQPDLTLLLLPTLETSLARARRRNTRPADPAQPGSPDSPDENRFETLDSAFYSRVFSKYREIAARDPRRVVAIEGDLPVDTVHERIVAIVLERLRRRTLEADAGR